MEFTFLVPLSIGLMVGYKAWGSRHDIAHLAVIFAVVNLLASLFLAPWEVKVILLIITALVVGPLWQSFDSKNNLQNIPTSDNKETELHYRGISYESPKSTVPIEKTQKISKCYRGIDYESSGTCTPQNNEVKGQVIKYRGVDIKAKKQD
ncbi:DUF4278 domain-containing protein [Synechocystis sp. PCC 7339]|uniref:DUF4278 domain-containing protein n=1 Tax=unclassified Synechocystis TaxID=2640012 RepID=UPI001BAF6B5B|nr:MULTISPECIES: DUF4278 domain-containing protein [unclassified Synechocystis]QUS60417.1 DUF4278 domain-containing protein [Synechocystis sp. PCC 7338]UAJ72140.1 DUF4278 domain-containing protein [Synechocystis sp. PCC 7339]